jgi:Family of unknown function (DUF5706)
MESQPGEEQIPKEQDIFKAFDESYAAWNLYTNLQSSIQFADTKINILFVLAGLILSIIATSANDFKTESIAFKIMFLVFLITMVPFMYYSIRTVAAHTEHKPDVKSSKNYFFGEIISMQASAYIKNFKANTRQMHYDELLLQIHNLSHIARKKFYNYGRALNVLGYLIVELLILLALKAIF